MPKFVLAYHGKPDIQTREEGAAHMAAWMAWSVGLGAAMLDPGMPVGVSKTVTATGVQEGGGANPLSGISIIQADTMEQAIALVQGCPHISGSGTIEVAEALDMKM